MALWWHLRNDLLESREATSQSIVPGKTATALGSGILPTTVGFRLMLPSILFILRPFMAFILAASCRSLGRLRGWYAAGE